MLKYLYCEISCDGKKTTENYYCRQLFLSSSTLMYIVMIPCWRRLVILQKYVFRNILSNLTWVKFSLAIPITLSILAVATSILTVNFLLPQCSKQVLPPNLRENICLQNKITKINIGLYFIINIGLYFIIIYY